MPTKRKNTLAEDLSTSLLASFHKLDAAIQRASTVSTGKKLYIFALVVYIVAQSYLTLGPLLTKAAPLEPDDAYSYMLKAAEISSGCTLQDCTALNDLRQQFQAPVEDTSLAAYRHRQYHRLFVQYSPLHASLVAGLHGAGLTFEDAFELVSVVGRIFIVTAVAYWLHVVWGPPGATVALLLLTLTVFDGQGLHYVVPGNLALGFGLITWALLFKDSVRFAKWLPPLVIVMSLFHPSGRIYALVSILLYFFFSKWPFERKTWLRGGSSFFLEIMVFMLPGWIDRPELKFDPVAFYPGTWNYLGSVANSLRESFAIIDTWMGMFGGPLLMFALVIVGLMLSNPNDRNKRIVIGLSLLSISAASLFYIVPFYGALAFERIWIATLIFCIGALGVAVAALLTWFYLQLRSSLTAVHGPLRHKKNLFSKRGWRIFFVAVVIAAFLFHPSAYYISGMQKYLATQEVMRGRFDVLLNPDQPSLIFGSEAKETQTVLYMHELSFYYYLTHGGLEQGAIFYPALVRTPDLKHWLDERSGRISHIVALNPVYGLPVTPEGLVLLKAEDNLAILGLEDIDLSKMEFLVGPRSESVTLQFVVGEGSQGAVTAVTLGPGSAEWVRPFNEAITAERITIRIAKNNSSAQIGGIRFSAESATLWPWEDEISLIFYNEDNEIRVEIKEEALLENLPLLRLEVLNDKGYSVLARIVD